MKRILFAVLILSFVGCAAPPSAITSTPITPTATSAATSTPTFTLSPTPSPTPLPPYPVVFSLEPASGPIAGGTELIIKGVNLAGATIQLDKEALTPLAQTDTEIRIVAPPHDNGIALIKIQSSLGTGYGEFLYLPPTLEEIPAGYITTVAGAGSFFGEGRLATQAMLDPNDIAVDANGNIYITEPGYGYARILRIRTDGVIELFAGTGFEGYSQDGIAAATADLWQPKGIALDKAGNLFFAEAFTHRVRRVDVQTGIITTVAGTGMQGFSGDEGPAIQAQLSFPDYIAIDADGNIFVLDSGNMRIRRISPDGIITTIAGTGATGYSGDGGPATEAEFDLLFVDAGGLAVNPSGDVFLADTNNNAVRRIDMSTGIITTVAHAYQVLAVTFDEAGNLYYGVDDYDLAQIIKMSPDGKTLETFGRQRGFSEDGTPALDILFGAIARIRIDGQGNILFIDQSVNRLRRINLTTGLLETVAGIGPAVIGLDGPAPGAVVDIGGSDLAFLPTGDLLIVDSQLDRVWRLDSEGRISAYLGNGLAWFFEQWNQPAEGTPISAPIAIEVAGDGSLFILNGNYLSKVDKEGILRHVAHKLSSLAGFSGDGGPATQGQLNQPWDVALDSQGNMYIADTNNNRIRRVDAVTGVITTVAGSGPINDLERYGSGTFCGDNGPAVKACLNSPLGIAFDREGNLFIADYYNLRIRKVDREGIITTFAQLEATKMVFDAEGNLYTVNAGGIFRISPSGIVTRLAGGSFGFSGDGGPALQAMMLPESQSVGIAIDSHGNLFFVDSSNRRVRVIKLAVEAPPEP